MFPRGFLGTRADLLMDIVITSLVLIVPLLYYSFRRARAREFTRHRNVQVTLTAVLIVVLIFFELNLKASGGFFEMTKGSRFAGHWLLDASLYVHLAFSVSTAVIWLGLIGSSLVRFPNPPTPGAFSRTHRFWGRVAMIDMVMTGITGLELYLVGLVL